MRWAGRRPVGPGEECEGNVRMSLRIEALREGVEIRWEVNGEWIAGCGVQVGELFVSGGDGHDRGRRL